jgi:hypothetical protein
MRRNPQRLNLEKRVGEEKESIKVFHNCEKRVAHISPTFERKEKVMQRTRRPR